MPRRSRKRPPFIDRPFPSRNSDFTKRDSQFEVTMTTRSILILTALAVGGVTGCASSSGSAAATQQSQPSSTHTHGSRDRITQDELANIDVQNALQAVQR